MLINNHIKLDEETHQYYLDLPSASTILDYIFGRRFDDVDPNVLTKASDRKKCIAQQLRTNTSQCYCNEKAKKHIDNAESIREAIDETFPNCDFSFEASFTNYSINGTIHCLGKEDDTWNILEYKFVPTKNETEWITQLTIYKLLVMDYYRIPASKIDTYVLWKDEVLFFNITDDEIERMRNIISSWHFKNCQCEGLYNQDMWANFE